MNDDDKHTHFNTLNCLGSFIHCQKPGIRWRVWKQEAASLLGENGKIER